MASSNLDLLRSLYANWERGHFRAPLEWAHQDIEFVSADGPTPGEWKGPDGMEEGWRDFLAAWEDFRLEVDEYRELDDERVLVLVRCSGRGKVSGLQLADMLSNGAALFHIRDGKVTRFVFWLKREHAFADLGFDPDANPPDR